MYTILLKQNPRKFTRIRKKLNKLSLKPNSRRKTFLKERGLKRKIFSEQKKILLVKCYIFQIETSKRYKFNRYIFYSITFYVYNFAETEPTKIYVKKKKIKQIIIKT